MLHRNLFSKIEQLLGAPLRRISRRVRKAVGFHKFERELQLASADFKKQIAAKASRILGGPEQLPVRVRKSFGFEALEERLIRSATIGVGDGVFTWVDGDGDTQAIDVTSGSVEVHFTDNVGNSGDITEVRLLSNASGFDATTANIDLINMNTYHLGALNLGVNVGSETADTGGTVDLIQGGLNVTGSVFIDGNVGTLQSRRVEGAMTITGDVGSISIVDGSSPNDDLAADLTVGGNLGLLHTGDDIQAAVTVGGDVGQIDVDSAVKWAGDIDITGNLGSFTVVEYISKDIIVGGDLNLLSAGQNFSGNLTAGRVVGQFDLSDNGYAYSNGIAPYAQIGFVGSTNTLTVTPVANTTPTTSGIGDVAVNEDANNTTINLNAVFDDVEDADSALTYSLVNNSNAGLFDSVTIDGSGNLILDYSANQFGTALITVRAADTLGAFVDTTFTVDVSAVNDTPLTSGLDNVNVSANAANTVVDLNDAFSDLEDADAALVYSVANNSNSSLFDAVAIDGSGNLTLAYAANASGTAQITIRATDTGGEFVETTFTVNIAGENSAPPTDNLVGHWEFESDATDSSVYENDATIINGEGDEFTTGTVGNESAHFDGVDDLIQTNSGESPQLTGDYTTSVWIRPDATQKNWAGIYTATNASGSTNHWNLQFNNQSQRSVVIYHGNQSWDTGIVLADVDDGQWHNIVVVREGTTMTVYLDGGMVKSGMFNNNPLGNADHFNIGGDRTSTTNYLYTGDIDDLRVYDTALSGADLLALFDSNNDAPTTNGLGDVQVTENAADTVLDLHAAFGDLEDADSALTYSIANNTNSALFDSVTIDGSGNLSLAYAANMPGTSQITIRATDSGGKFVETTFAVNVAESALVVSEVALEEYADENDPTDDNESTNLFSNDEFYFEDNSKGFEDYFGVEQSQAPTLYSSVASAQSAQGELSGGSAAAHAESSQPTLSFGGGVSSGDQLTAGDVADTNSKADSSDQPDVKKEQKRQSQSVAAEKAAQQTTEFSWFDLNSHSVRQYFEQSSVDEATSADPAISAPFALLPAEYGGSDNEEFSESTTTAATVGMAALSVGYTAYLLKDLPWLAGGVASMGYWSKLDPLPVLDAFDRKQERKEREKLAAK